MKKNIATRISYECEMCGTHIENTIPYTFPDGTRFPWEMPEIEAPECPAQYAKDSGYPASHKIKLLKWERVKEDLLDIELSQDNAGESKALGDA